jgi:hypothetical protein
MIPDHTIDFAFSFDSLVHADEEAIESYVSQLSTKLKNDGVAFIHHSNIGAYIHSLSRVMWDYQGTLSKALKWKGFPEDHARARTMTAKKFLEYTEKAGLCCMSQECIGWGSSKLIDCISTLTPRGSIWERPTKIMHNNRFMKEVTGWAKAAELYGQHSFKKPVWFEEENCEMKAIST